MKRVRRTFAAFASLAVPTVVVAVVTSSAGCDDCNKAPAASADGAADGPASSGSGSAQAARTPAGGEAGVGANALPLPAASVASMVNPKNLPAYSGPTGSVEGTVTVIGDAAWPTAGVTAEDFAKCPSAGTIWGKRFREGPVGAGGARALADAIVVVTGYSGSYVPEKTEAKDVVIQDCGYKARTVTLTFGQRIEVKNETREFWTPILAPGPNLVMMMAAPKGDPVKIYPKQPGHHLLLDRDRQYAIVDVYAFLHPHHAATDLFGHYRIDGIPVGKLKVSTKHPNIDDNAEKDVEIQSGVVTTMDLQVKNTNRDAGPPAPSSSVFHPVLR